MTVYFHANFGLNRQNMASILELALKNPKLRDKDLAKPFGYGAPFAARTRSWLHKTGITKLGLPIRPTDEGNVILKYDPNFKTLTTQWFMHWELSQDPKRAEAWHFFVDEFLPKHKSFTMKNLLKGLTQKLRYHSEKHFGPGSKLSLVISRKLIECYTQDYALGKLRIIHKEHKLFVRGKALSTLGPWDSLIKFNKAYTVLG